MIPPAARKTHVQKRNSFAERPTTRVQHVRVMLTGKNLFDAPNSIALLLKHITEKPPSLKDHCPAPVPDALEALVMQCLAKSASERPSALAMRAILAESGLAGAWSEKQAVGWWEDHMRNDVVDPGIGPPISSEERAMYGRLARTQLMQSKVE